MNSSMCAACFDCGGLVAMRIKVRCFSLVKLCFYGNPSKYGIYLFCFARICQFPYSLGIAVLSVVVDLDVFTITLIFEITDTISIRSLLTEAINL